MVTPNGVSKPADAESTRLLPVEQESRLLTYDESLRLVPWQTDNDRVLSGYRRELGSIPKCLWSAVACELSLLITFVTGFTLIG